MRAAVLVPALLVAVFAAPAAQVAIRPAESAPAERGRPGRATFLPLERRFDEILLRAAPDDPVDLLGSTRGVYLDGYGAVFSAEVSLVVTPTINPFRQVITKEESERVHKRKLAHLPMVRQAVREMLVASGSALDSVPANEQIVVVVRLLYLSWEDTTGLPGQILMKADRRTLLNKAALDSGIHTEEN